MSVLDELREVARDELDAVEVVGVAKRGQCAEDPGHVGAVEAEVGQVRVAVRVAGLDGAVGGNVVGVVAIHGAVHLEVVRGWEGA